METWYDIYVVEIKIINCRLIINIAYEYAL